MIIRSCRLPFIVVLALAARLAWAQPQGEIKGEVKGTAFEHSAASAAAALMRASVVLPANATGGALYAGPYQDAPASARARVPVVVFLHGSSGLSLKAIGEWQRWLAGLGIASVAPDSFALPDRISYTSPVGKDVYEKIHALRAAEIELALQALASAPWADRAHLVLAGASEGAVAVARYSGSAFVGRIVYSWSCEDNYFVREHRTAVSGNQPVLNVMSSTDPYFSRANPWLGNPSAAGHCGEAFKGDRNAAVVLVPGAPHTLINLPAARYATQGFLQDLLAR